MTMPIKRLVESGIPRAHAEALAEVQAMFTRSEAAMKEWVRAEIAAKLRPLYWLHGVNIVMSAIILAKLFL